jgi:hypothetical protein
MYERRRNFDTRTLQAARDPASGAWSACNMDRKGSKYQSISTLRELLSADL